MSTTTCPACGAAVPQEARFCEECGAALGGAAPAAPTTAEIDELAPISAPTYRTPAAPPPTPVRACLSCGGTVGEDGYCEVCGTKAPSERDHFREDPAPWVAGVCDRGIRHRRNEDAMALLASATPGERAVLVVLDGVSNSIDSDVASLAGARAAREVLRTPLPRGMGTPESRVAAVTKVLTDAAVAANEAVVETTDPASANPASATYAVAVLEGGVLAHANIGDSRVYWLPDGGPGSQLSVDDSAAQMHIEAGMSRAEAESGPQAHAITRWLGRDAPEIAPRLGTLELDTPGWVLVCSDGLWNYASEPDSLAAQVAAAGTAVPAELALALVAFANAQGGQDNITVALARFDPTRTTEQEESHG
ncbi:MAG TPA: protein phosphatase 2C domain-containing protein [Nocardioides sp.]|uniref:protein phosphatase 2C domain-containing protein n=1 Tax=Nocardioides sp. TaxID=35761 RepID=UPI002BD94904|nr:protein phosphatase 2C domain-containing protein [Nocardioides sp.]HTW16486.1 protein phosphatase 2C domain-containing protein [Nocardioides sp.]